MVRLPKTPFDRTTVTGDGEPEREWRSYGDLINPSSIEHMIDEAVDLERKQIEFRYEFLEYHFAVAAGQVRARAYLDEMDHAAIYLPDGMTLEHADALRVLHYLARRFREVRTLGPDGYQAIEIEFDDN